MDYQIIKIDLNNGKRETVFNCYNSDDANNAIAEIRNNETEDNINFRILVP